MALYSANDVGMASSSLDVRIVEVEERAEAIQVAALHAPVMHGYGEDFRLSRFCEAVVISTDPAQRSAASMSVSPFVTSPQNDTASSISQ